MSTLQSLKIEILEINALSRYRNSNSGELLSKKAQDIISDIQVMAGGKGLTHLRNSNVIRTVPNDMIASIADSVIKYGRCSEKQAYCLAKYALENGISVPAEDKKTKYADESDDDYDMLDE